MTMIDGGGVGATAVTAPEADRLRQATRQLEGVFVEQLFKAMRETVPEGGLLDGGAGEEIFSGMMDSHLAAQVPGSLESGLGAALYRQLRGAAEGTAPTGATLTEEKGS